LVLVEFQKGYTERKTIYLIGIEVPDSWKDSILKSCGVIGNTIRHIKNIDTMSGR
jgi:hypothetical protein